MSILIDIPNIYIINVFALDYMHLVCLGVTIKLIHLWLSKGNLNVRIRGQKIKELDSSLISFKNMITCDFPRKPRGLTNEINRWKATEFKQFLLYTGPIVLKNILSKRCYINFLCLHISIQILVSPKLSNLVGYSNELLTFFILVFCNIYGSKWSSHNVHALQHISDDYNKFEPLDNISAFPFENHMKILKKTVRKNDQPLSQSVKRYNEIFKFTKIPLKYTFPLFKNQHFQGPLLENLCDPQYKILILETFKIKIYNDADNFVMLKNNDIVKVLNICSTQSGKKVIIGNIFKSKKSFYSKPIDSSHLGIFLIEDLSKDNLYWDINEIQSKYMVLTFDNNKLVAFQ